MDLRILLDPRFDVLNPLVLIGRRQRAGDNREIARAVQDPVRLVGQRIAQPLRRRLIDEEVARIRLGIGIPGDHLDALRPRLAQHATKCPARSPPTPRSNRPRA